MIDSNNVAPGFASYLVECAAFDVGGSFNFRQMELFRSAAMAAITAHGGDSSGGHELARYTGTIQPHRAHFPEGSLDLDIIAATNRVTREWLGASSEDLL